VAPHHRPIQRRKRGGRRLGALLGNAALMHQKKDRAMQRFNTVLQMGRVVTILGLTSLALPLPALARVAVSVSIGVPVVVAPVPVIVAPAPVVVAPPPVVVGGGYYRYGHDRSSYRGYDRYPHRHGRHHHHHGPRW
jgi:hypothetical protein